jgi:hypothetical protein
LLNYYSQKDLKNLLKKRHSGGLSPYDAEALNDVESFMSKYVKGMQFAYRDSEKFLDGDFYVRHTSGSNGKR